MKDTNTHLYANDSEMLQITHKEYVSLIEKEEEAKRLQEVKEAVIADLQHFLVGGVTEKTPTKPVYSSAEPEVRPVDPEPELSETEAPEVEKIAIEFSAEEPEQSEELEQSVPEQNPALSMSGANGRNDMLEEPPIKQEIVEHFHKLDESGRLLNVFKQYYTYLNKMCGGTVRVTMKDGFCSLWNYDAWEEFAFVDIFEGLLRIAIDPRYTDELKSLSLCEAPRLISGRRNVICVQVDDLNNVVLEVLARAFSEAGMPVK